MSGLHDGQKTIWLQVMRALTRYPGRFKVSVKTFESVNEQSPWVHALRDLSVDVEGQPLIVSWESLAWILRVLTARI